MGMSTTGGGVGLSASLGASLSASRTSGGGAPRKGGAPDTSNRPQLVDVTGRNVTPKPLIPFKDGEQKKAAAAGARNRSLAASAISQSSEAEEDKGEGDGFETDRSERAESVASEDGGGADAAASKDAEVAANTVSNAGRADALPAASAAAHGPLAAVFTEASSALNQGVDVPLWLHTLPVPPLPTGPTNSKLTEHEQDAVVSLMLRETPTTILFAMPAVRVQADTVEHRAVTAANEKYTALLTACAKSGAELYPSRGTATVNPPSKSKEVMTAPAVGESVQVQTHSWQVSDAYAALAEAEAAGMVVPGVRTAGVSVGSGADTQAAALPAAASSLTPEAQAALEAHVDALVSASLAVPGCLIDAEGEVRVHPLLAEGGGHGRGGLRASMQQTSVSGGRSGVLASGSLGGGGGAHSARLGKSGVAGAHGSTASATATGAGGLPEADSLASVSVTSLGSSVAGGAGGKLGEGSAADAATPGKADGGIDTSLGATDMSTLDVATLQQADRILTSRSLLDNLALVERAVQQNLYNESHKLYRAQAGADLISKLLSAGLQGGHAAAAKVMQYAEQGPPPLVGFADAVGGGRARGVMLMSPGGDADEDDEPGAGGSFMPGAGRGSRRTSQNDADTEHAGGAASSPRSRAAATREASGTVRRTVSTGGMGGAGGMTAFDAHTESPALVKLWSYECALVDGLNVSCMAWNKANRDLLAVGYGSHDFSADGSGRRDGVIALWSISNPEYPQALLKTPGDVGVTAIDFSTAHPSMLAAGLSNGIICVYDVKRILLGEVDGTPGLISDKLQVGAHTEAVWQVKWVARQDVGEVLVSVSTDGRVTQWDCKKALAPTPLMTLKRARALGAPAAAPNAAATTDAPVPGAASTAAAGGNGAAPPPPAAGADILGLPAGTAVGDGILARTASGLTVDFVPSDTTQYFVGTEDGLLARCSTSYTEQYLEVIQAHAGPVNRCRISPFLPTMLLTCSADWTVKLWAITPGSSAGGTSNPPSVTFSVDDVKDAVTDIAWSPVVSTIFSAVTRDGHVQVWDAASLTPLIDSVSTMDPALWREKVLAEQAEAAVKAAAAAAEARRKRRAEMGYDDDDEDDDLDLASNTRHEGVGVRTKSAGGAYDDADDGAGSAHSGEEEETETLPPPPRKRLTCVLFADTNTQILVTGDATGRVDVFRIVGLDDVMDTTTASSNAGGGVDANQAFEADGSGDAPVATALQASATPAAGKHASAAQGGGFGLAVGSEAYEAQLSALQQVLGSMLSS